MLALLVLWIAPVVQDPGWLDTHRVHLRNGNFLDGKLEQINEKDILFRWNPGVLVRIKLGDIRGDVEVIKIRALNSKPPSVVVKEAAPVDETSVAEAPLARNPAKPQSAIDKLFTRLMAQPDMTYELLVREVKALGPGGAKAMIQEMPYMDPVKTNLALVALDQMKELPIEGEIRDLLASKRGDLRAAACTVLANRGATGSIRSVEGLLRDSAPQVRTAAVKALLIYGDGSALESVAKLALDPVPSVRAKAIRGAEDLASRASSSSDLARLWLGIAARGSAAIKTEIAASLGRLADRADEAFPADDVREFLKRLLTDREPEARAGAAFALSGVKPAGASADALLEALAFEREPKVLVSLCDGLGRVAVFNTMEPLIERLRADSKEVKAAAQRALEKISGRSEFGADADKWREWFDNNRGRNP